MYILHFWFLFLKTAAYVIDTVIAIVNVVNVTIIALEEFGLKVMSETAISVSGSMNCKKPVRDSGTFPVA